MNFLQIIDLHKKFHSCLITFLSKVNLEFATLVLSIIGTIIIEKIISPKIGKYKKEEEQAKTEQYKVLDIESQEQKPPQKAVIIPNIGFLLLIK